MSIRTADGMDLSPGTAYYLFTPFGTRVCGVVNHYGSEGGWQITDRGIKHHVKDLYKEELAALAVQRDALRASLKSVEDRIEELCW